MTTPSKLKKRSVVTAAGFRANVYRILDRVLDTGVPVEIERNGHILRIVADRPSSWLYRRPSRLGFIKGDPDQLIHVDWSSERRPP
jgi:hypothetical protein